MIEKEKIWAVKDGYLVNRDGSIYKLNWCRTTTMRKIKQSKQTCGYLYFWKNDKPYLSHRFIAECFIPNPNDLPEINHKDENKQNNCVDNLEWCEHKYNVNYGLRNEKISISNKGKKRNEATRKKISDGHKKRNEATRKKTICQYTINGRCVKKWNSLNEIRNAKGFKMKTISECCKGKLESAYGYFWRCEIS